MHFHHIGISFTKARKEFANVRFVIVCGTNERAYEIANSFGPEYVSELANARFVLYKVLNIIVCSHGMGGPSLSICVNELIQALKMSNNMKNVTFIRVGTSGGIGVPAGTVICTTEALDENLKPSFSTNILGTLVTFPTQIHYVKNLQNVLYGKTVSANCFYENQGRTDGAFCIFTAKQKQEYLDKLYKLGVLNIEMEIVPFVAIVHRAGYKAMACCITLVDRQSDDKPAHLVNMKNLFCTVHEIIYKLSKHDLICSHRTSRFVY
jgi:uridine phosphorylase